MKISVIIPAHNEEKLIGKAIREVKNSLNGINYEVVAIDDNSSDSTGKILDRISKKDKKIRVIHLRNPFLRPSGLGNALINGFKNSSGDILIPFMGDLSDNANDILKMIKKIEEGYDVVCGSRFIEGSSLENYPLVKLIANRIWNNLFAFLFNLKIKDISNAFKAYKKEVVKKVVPKCKGFEITAEIVLKAHIQGFRIVEVPVSWKGRTYGESKFGSFSISFIFSKLILIGFHYGNLAFKLWILYLLKKIKRLFPF